MMTTCSGGNHVLIDVVTSTVYSWSVVIDSVEYELHNITAALHLMCQNDGRPSDFYITV